MEDLKERAARRLVRLVADLGAEERALRGERGWKRRVAEQIGISRDYVHKIDEGIRTGAGPEAIAKAIERLRIQPAYFYDDHPELSYREFLTSVGSVELEGDSVEPPEIHVEDYEHRIKKYFIASNADRMTVEDAEWVEALDFEGDVTIERLRERWLERLGIRSGKLREPEPVKTEPRPGRVRLPESSKKTPQKPTKKKR